MTARHKNNPLRRRIAYEAARLMAEEGVTDLERARRKAAERVRVNNRHLWPPIADIQEALTQQQRLFQPEQQDALAALRERAMQAMQAFSRFRPRLIGPVLDGTADPNSRVMLYLFAESPDEIIHELMEQGIPWEERQRQLRYTGGDRRTHPVFRFIAGEIPIELLALPLRALSNPPLSPVTDRPDRGAGIQQLKELMGAQPINNPYLREMGT